MPMVEVVQTGPRSEQQEWTGDGRSKVGVGPESTSPAPMLAAKRAFGGSDPIRRIGWGPPKRVDGRGLMLWRRQV